MEPLSIDPESKLWNRFFTVAPLIVVGTIEPTGEWSFAPKHMATPLGWGPYFGFVCSPRHRTYHNIAREGSFTVTFVQADQILLTSLAACPHCDQGPKPEAEALPSRPAQRVRGAFVEGGYAYLECELDRLVDGFGDNSLIAGRVVAAQVDPACLRHEDRDDQDLLMEQPLLAYLAPGRWARVQESWAFPFPANFAR